MNNSAIPNSIDLIQDSCCSWNHDSISAHPSELDHTSNVENPIDILTSYPFLEIELEHNPELQFGYSISFPDLILNEVFLSEFRPFPESVLDSVQSIVKLNHQLFMIIILNLTNFILLKVSLTNWQALIIMKLNSIRNVT